MRSVGFAFTALVASMMPASADDGCDKFAWPLTRERALFAATDKVTVQSGGTIAALSAAAIVLSLLPSEEASVSGPRDEKARTRHWYGGTASFPAPDKAGIYQVTLSDEAWVDVVQDGRVLPSIAHSWRKDCPGLRKSVRFELSAKPFVVQVGRAEVDHIALAISPAP